MSRQTPYSIFISIFFSGWRSRSTGTFLLACLHIHYAIYVKVHFMLWMKKFGSWFATCLTWASDCQWENKGPNERYLDVTLPFSISLEADSFSLTVWKIRWKCSLCSSDSSWNGMQYDNWDSISQAHHTAATGLFCQGGKIESRLLKFCQSHATPLPGTAKCDLATFKQPAVTFCFLVKIVWPWQCHPSRLCFS